LESLTRRRFLQGTAGLAAAAVLADAAILEPNFPRLVRVEVPLLRLPEAFDGFTIVQLSDFHYDPYLSIHAIRAAVEMTNQLQPDVVALTGDFVTLPLLPDFFERRRSAALDAEPCGGLLSALNAREGRFCVLGNHDVSTSRRLITEILNSFDLHVLDNRSVVLERSGARLWFAGMDDRLDGDPDIDLALKGIPAGDPVVMLVHEPDVADNVKQYPVDLQLSGHSHGGQVSPLGIGPIYLPAFARKYPRGLYDFGSLVLYTNIGLGTIRIPVRINCPPEVTFLTLRSRKV
jgi:predicted MPP superfamily phosphohydrolase